MKKATFYIIFVLIYGLYFPNCFAGEDFKVLIQDGKARLTYQVTGVNMVMVSALDAENNPVRGLKPEHFVIKKDGKKARVLSVEPLEATEKVSLNIVLVVDNSLSMKKREAVEPLMSALEEFFKIVRPIDNVHVVVFDDKPGLKVVFSGLTVFENFSLILPFSKRIRPTSIIVSSFGSRPVVSRSRATKDSIFSTNKTF